MQPESGLSYQISQRNAVIVVTLTGSLTRDNLAPLERLQKEILNRKFAWVVLHFQGVPERADQTVLPLLARIQKAVRDQGGQLRLTSLRPGLRQLMEDRGVLRSDECGDDLVHTLQMLARAA